MQMTLAKMPLVWTFPPPHHRPGGWKDSRQTTSAAGAALARVSGHQGEPLALMAMAKLSLRSLHQLSRLLEARTPGIPSRTCAQTAGQPCKRPTASTRTYVLLTWYANRAGSVLKGNWDSMIIVASRRKCAR